MRLTQYTIDSGVPGNNLLITAGVHGDEFEPMVAAGRLVDIARKKIRRGKIIIVPVVNDPAFQLGQRCAEDGLDLARICPGQVSGSISRSVAYDISTLIRSADYYIDLHNGGKLFSIFPLAGYMLHHHEAVLDVQRRMAKTFSLPVVWGTDAAPDGRTLSVARDANIPAIYVEYGGGSSFNTAIAQALTDGCEKVMASLGFSDEGQPKNAQPLYFVEDQEKDSGHLQVKMPSPCDGIFIPEVTLGDKVEAGHRWGIVYDPVTTSGTEVLADRKGIVLFIRAFPKVSAGESLGGILVEHS